MDMSFIALMRGDPAPRFQAATATRPHFNFDTVAGRYIVLCFFVSGGTPGGAAALQAVALNRNRFDDERMCFFGVTVDPKDRDSRRAQQSLPGVRYFWDFDGSVCKAYGAVPREAAAGRPVNVRQFWMVRLISAASRQPPLNDQNPAMTRIAGRLAKAHRNWHQTNGEGKAAGAARRRCPPRLSPALPSQASERSSPLPKDD